MWLPTALAKDVGWEGGWLVQAHGDSCWDSPRMPEGLLMSSQASCQIQMPSLKLSQTPRSFPKSGFQNFLPFQRPSSVLNESILSLNFLMNLRSEFGVRWGDGILVSSARTHQLNCWLLKEVVLRDHDSVVWRVRPWECPSGP